MWHQALHIHWSCNPPPAILPHSDREEFLARVQPREIAPDLISPTNSMVMMKLGGYESLALCWYKQQGTKILMQPINVVDNICTAPVGVQSRQETVRGPLTHPTRRPGPCPPLAGRTPPAAQPTQHAGFPLQQGKDVLVEEECAEAEEEPQGEVE